MDTLVEGNRCAKQRLERHRAGLMRGLPQTLRIHKGEGRHRRMCLRSINERDAFLRRQRDRLELVLLEHRGRGARLAAVYQLALADHRQREMREWREVAAGADAALLRNGRMQ